MRLRVLGSNGTYPTPGRPGSGYLIDHEATTVLLDAGPATFPALQTHLAPAALDAVVITHAHGDHSVDLFALFNALRYGPEERRGLPVMIPAGVIERVAAFLGAGPDHDLFEVFDFDVVGGGEHREVGSLHLSFGEASHSVPALVVAVTAGERRLVYSGDTGPGGDLAAVAAGADLLLCEATYQGTPGPDAYPYHLWASQAGSIARDAAVARLVVTHVAPALDPGVSVEEARRVFRGPVAWAAPGMEVIL